MPWTGVSEDGWLWMLDSRNLPSEWEVLRGSVRDALRRFAERGAKKCGGEWRDLEPLTSVSSSKSTFIPDTHTHTQFA